MEYIDYECTVDATHERREQREAGSLNDAPLSKQCTYWSDIRPNCRIAETEPNCRIAETEPMRSSYLQSDREPLHQEVAVPVRGFRHAEEDSASCAKFELPGRRGSGSDRPKKKKTSERSRRHSTDPGLSQHSSTSSRATSMLTNFSSEDGSVRVKPVPGTGTTASGESRRSNSNSNNSSLDLDEDNEQELRAPLKRRKSSGGTAPRRKSSDSSKGALIASGQPRRSQSPPLGLGGERVPSKQRRSSGASECLTDDNSMPVNTIQKPKKKKSKDKPQRRRSSRSSSTGQGPPSSQLSSSSRAMSMMTQASLDDSMSSMALKPVPGTPASLQPRQPDKYKGQQTKETQRKSNADLNDNSIMSLMKRPAQYKSDDGSVITMGRDFFVVNEDTQNIKLSDVRRSKSITLPQFNTDDGSVTTIDIFSIDDDDYDVEQPLTPARRQSLGQPPPIFEQEEYHKAQRHYATAHAPKPILVTKNTGQMGPAAPPPLVGEQTKETTTKKQRTMWRLTFALLVVVVLGAVAVIVALARGNKDGGAAPTSDNPPSTAPPRTNTNFASLALEDLIQFFAPISDGVIPETPQYNAVLWLANNSNKYGVAIESLTQRYLMLVVYFSLLGTSTNTITLDPTLHECDWATIATITCRTENVFDGRQIVSLDFSNRQLNGYIPREIGSLSTLETLRLNDNALRYTIPTSIGKLSNLVTFEAERNALTGEIPKTIGSMTALHQVDMSHNLLVGSIPDSMFNLGDLATLDLSFNRISGSLSEDIAGLSSLSYLNVRNNRIAGSLPNALSSTSLSRLAFLLFDYNAITGRMPDAFDFLSKFEEVTGQNNLMTGTMPQTAPDGQILAAAEAISKGLYKLSHINMSQNFFSGGIPLTIALLPALKALDVQGNMFDGPVSGFFGSKVEHVSFARNHFNGTLPNSFGSELVHIDYSGNDFAGGIPTQLGRLSRLEWLSLSDNLNVNGPIPSELGNITTLTYMSIDNCSLTGAIPEEFGTLKNLEFLHIDRNALTGTVPKSLCSVVVPNAEILVDCFVPCSCCAPCT